MTKQPSLSVVTVCSGAISKEFFLKELIESVLDIADEIIIVNADNFNTSSYEYLGIRDDDHSFYEAKSETFKLIHHEFYEYFYKGKIKIYSNPWESRLGKNMYFLQKNIALSHATGDFVLRLDSDEIIHEEDHEKIKLAMGLGYDAYTFKVLHFWRDFQHLKVGENKADPGQNWYEQRVHLFKNNMGFLEGHDKFGNYTDSMIDKDYNPLIERAKHTSIKVYHLGHVRSKEVYLKKKNDIERAFHPDWQDLTDWEWDMSGTIPFEGTHPKVMEKRIGRN